MMPAPNQEEAKKLSIVALMMDEYTRDENAHYIHVVQEQADRIRRDEDTFFRMADEILRLTDLVNARNRHIGAMTEAMQYQASMTESYRVANETMAQLIERRDSEGVVFAGDQYGVRHPVRLMTDEELEGETTEEEDMEDEELDEIIAHMDV